MLDVRTIIDDAFARSGELRGRRDLLFVFANSMQRAGTTLRAFLEAQRNAPAGPLDREHGAEWTAGRVAFEAAFAEFTAATIALTKANG